MNEVTSEHMIYVWTKTENAGKIVEVDSEKEDPKWLYFTDGNRINKSLINEMLMAAKDEEDAKSISKTFGGIGNATPPKTNGKETPKPAQKEVKVKSEPQPEVNVMMEMLAKMSKKNQAEMPVKVNIPAIQVYEMLKDQMDLDDADLNEQIGLLIENQINNLQDQLRSQIQSFITKYYSNE